MNPEPSPIFLPLSDGRPGLRTTMQVEIHEPRAAAASPSRGEEGKGESEPSSGLRENSCNSCETPSDAVLDFVSSDESLDRYGEIISAAGWELASYHRNPVFQNAHQYGDIIFTLGRALVTEVRGGRLFQRIKFATDVNPMAKIAYGLYRGKFLSAVSVGFIPLRWENGDPSNAGIPAGESRSLSSLGGEGRGEEVCSLNCSPASVLRSPQFRRRYLAQELLEVSAVAIPANPNALALGLKSGAVQKSDLQDLSDLLRHTLASPPEPTDLGSPTLDLRLQTLDFLRQLHQVMKHT